MIDLHYWPTPNGWKVSIMLEECGLPYALKPVNIGRGEQFRPEFLAISPNNRMPAIVDHAPADGGDRLQLVFDPATGPTQQVVRWTGASNRWYALQESPTLADGAVWSNRATNLPASGTLNVHTLALPEAWSFLRLTVATKSFR